MIDDSTGVLEVYPKKPTSDAFYQDNCVVLPTLEILSALACLCRLVVVFVGFT